MRIYEAKIHYNIIELGEIASLDSPEEAIKYMKGAFEEYPTQESIWVVALDRKNKPIARSMVTLGTANSSLIHAREIFRYAILQSASGLLVFHNHPSGNPAPSAADISVTRMLREAAKVVGIDLVDHIIVGNPVDDPLGKGHYSFSDAGFI